MQNKDRYQVIASALADVYSWTSDDLEEDFANYITESCPDFRRDLAIRVLKSFDELDPLKRDSATFDLAEFVQRELASEQISK